MVEVRKLSKGCYFDIVSKKYNRMLICCVEVEERLDAIYNSVLFPNRLSKEDFLYCVIYGSNKVKKFIAPYTREYENKYSYETLKHRIPEYMMNSNISIRRIIQNLYPEYVFYQSRDEPMWAMIKWR